MIFQFSIKCQEDQVLGFEKELMDILTRLIDNQVLDVYEIHFCVHEAILNIIQHTYKWDLNKPLDIRLDINDKNGTFLLEVYIRDYGEPVKAVIKPPSKVGSFQLRKRGLYMVGKIMDEFYIEPLERTGNKTYMRKQFILLDPKIVN